MRVPLQKALLWAAAVVSFCAPAWKAQENRPPSGSGKPIAVVIERVQGQVAYAIESKVVTKKDVGEALRVFANLLEERGANSVVLIFLDGDVPFNELREVDGIAGKVGFARFRYFVFGRDRRYMSEISFIRRLPFSTEPPLD